MGLGFRIWCLSVWVCAVGYRQLLYCMSSGTPFIAFTLNALSVNPKDPKALLQRALGVLCSCCMRALQLPCTDGRPQIFDKTGAGIRQAYVMT